MHETSILIRVINLAVSHMVGSAHVRGVLAEYLGEFCQNSRTNLVEIKSRHDRQLRKDIKLDVSSTK